MNQGTKKKRRLRTTASPSERHRSPLQPLSLTDGQAVDKGHAILIAGGLEATACQPLPVGERRTNHI